MDTTINQDTPKEQVIAFILGQPKMAFVDWAFWMGEGVVIELHIKRTRFRKMLTLSRLGIHTNNKQEAEKLYEVYRPGMISFLPRAYQEKLDRVDNRGRMLLKAYGLKTIWGRFVPVTAFADWQERIAKLEAEYYDIRDDILANYESIRKKVIRDHMEASRHAYRVCMALSKEALSEGEQARESAYLRRIAREARYVFPSKEAILRSFSFTVGYTYIDLPRLVEDENETKVSIKDLTPEQTREIQNTRGFMEQRRDLMLAMNREVVSEAKRQKRERIDAFFTDVIIQCRALVAEAATNVLANIQKNQRFHNKSEEELIILCDNLKRLNFYGDKELDQAMTLIESLLKGGRKNVSLPRIQEVLSNLAIVMRSSVLSLSLPTEDREEREEETYEILKMEQRAIQRRLEAGIPEEPSEREEREARQMLGFAIPFWCEDREEREEETYAVSVGEIEEREERLI